MNQYAYLVEVFDYDAKTLNEALNRLGQEGWQLIKIDSGHWRRTEKRKGPTGDERYVEITLVCCWFIRGAAAREPQLGRL